VNPILFAGLYGLFKGLASGPAPALGGAGRRYTHLQAPVFEETLFRKLPHALFGDYLPPGYTAAGFALAHLGEPGMSGLDMALRFADVFAGGLIYETAYKRHGWFGAICAHAAHNIALGLSSSPHTLRSPEPRPKPRRKLNGQTRLP